MNMKRFTNFLLTFGLILPMMVFSTISRAQQIADLAKEQDTLKEHVSSLRDKVSGVEERLATAEADISKLTKIWIRAFKLLTLSFNWIRCKIVTAVKRNQCFIAL